MPFAIPIVWREPQNHLNVCYFCRVKRVGFSAKTKHKIVYPSLDSAIWPFPHEDSLPVPVLPHDGLVSVEGDEEYGEGVACYNPDSSNHDYMADEDS